MEYIPGWGDVLKANLPQLGSAVQDIIDPAKKFQVALRAEIAKNPAMLGQLATIAKDNPQGLNQVFGEDVSGFFSSLNETPEARLSRQVASSAQSVAAQRPNDVGAAALNIKDPTTAARDDLNLDQERKLATFLAELPEEERNNAYFKQVAGVFRFDYDKLQTRARNIESAKAIAGLDTNEVFRQWRSGKLNGATIQGWLDLNPDALSLFMGELEFSRNAQLRRDLAKEARANGRFDLMQQLYLNSAKDAARLNVNPGALFEANYGFAAPDVVGGLHAAYTPEDIKNAKVALQREEHQARAKLMKPVLEAQSALLKKRSPGNIAIFNAAAQAAGLELRVEEEDRRFRPDKLIYYWNGQQVDEQTLNTILTTGREPVGTNETKEPGVNPPATQSRTSGTVPAPIRPDLSQVINQYQGNPSGLIASPEYTKMSESERQRAIGMVSRNETVTPSAKIKQGGLNPTAFSSNDAVAFVNFAVAKGYTKAQIEASAVYQKLSPKDKQAVLANLEF